jgi:hypothetical protein
MHPVCSFSSRPTSTLLNNIDVIYLGLNETYIYSQLVYLFSLLPKFAHSTPIPYSKRQLHSLHKENLSIIDNFLCNNQLDVPNQISDFFTRSTSISSFPLSSYTTSTSPWHRLKFFLQQNNLLLTPADKTHHLVIWPLSTYLEEFNLHLLDTTTYTQITPQHATDIQNCLIQTVKQASLFFNDSTLFVASPKPRYFYLLPKIQKPLNLWRIPFFHPKCRPIISDVTSCTFKLSKRLLSYTQRLEHKLSTVALSSLNIVSFFEHNPTLQPTFNNFSNHPNLVLATCDVESLFTKIPLDNLLSLLNHNLPSVCSNPDECSTILSFLHSIITNNTFFGRGQFYLQKIGLAMGACMSSSLANIYLGFLESRILRHFSPPVLLYKRYMDDIFILINNEQNLLETFLSFLHNTFNLTITSSSSPSQVTFLDLRVHIYPHHFDVTFFSKTNIPFRLPLHSDKRPPRQQIYLFKSQLLRLWRVSTNTEYLSQQIIYILNLLPLTGLRRLLTSTLYQFFKPVNISPIKWLPYHFICHNCITICADNHIIVRKIFDHFDVIIASKSPISCHSIQTYFLLFYPPCNLYYLTNAMSLHDILHFYSHPFLQILPFSNTPIYSNDNIFNRVPISALFDVPEKVNNSTLFLHKIFRDSSLSIYGLPSFPKRRQTTLNFFNNYKHATHTTILAT